MFRNILVAVDGSSAADLALTHAIDLAQSGRARLTLFTAIARPPRFGYWGFAAPEMIRFSEHAEAEAEKIALRARDRVPDDVSVAGVLTRKPARTALVRQISDGHHDLVVLGSSGGGAVRSAMLRSVTHHALHQSPVPVLVVHAEPSAGSVLAEGTPVAHGSGSEAA